MIRTPFNPKLLSRRAFLKRSSAAALALSPFVPTLNLEAQESGVPKRIIFFNTFNGTVPDEFFPNDTGRDFELKRVLDPLESFREKMLILGNVDMSPAPSGAHTGQGMLLTNTIPNSDRLGTSISVDQFIANRIGLDTPFNSLHLGNVTQGGVGVFFRGAVDQVIAEDDAYRSFDRLFGNIANGSTSRLSEKRSSVIDGVLDDLNRFRGTLGTDDRQLVDLHLESLRSLERELSSEVVCSAPDIEFGIDLSETVNMPQISRINNQIAVSALSCGTTRVIGMPFLRPVRNHALTFLGLDEGLHDISHNAVSNSTEKYITIQRWYSEQLLDLCQRLEAVPEGDGTMLDNTLVVWSNPLSRGNAHSKTNLPIVMIGGGWHFDLGQYVRYSGESHGKWLVSLCHAMGIEVSNFGRREFSDGPLSGITL